MADLSDIEQALVTLIADAVFADPYLPGAVQASTAGTSIRAYRGWPIQATLLADVRAGLVNVSVFSEQGMTRDTSRWQPEMVQVTTVEPTITAFASGATVTLSGTITAGNVVGIQSGSPLTAYAYIVRTSDTLATVAAALALKASATSVGAVITMPTRLNLTAATMTPQTTLTITRQQQQGFRISIWAPTPATRDTISGLIDGGIAGLRGPTGFQTRWFTVDAYEMARIEYRSTFVNDMPSREGIWRRDLCYSVEYCTSLIEQDPIMLFGGGDLSVGTPPTVVGRIGAIAPV